MRLDFRHPVIARGIHAKSLQEKIMVGMVSTPVEIQDLWSGDVMTAFEVECTDPAKDFEIIQHEGLLYQKAGFDIGDLLGPETTFEALHYGLTRTELPFRPLGGALAASVREMACAGTAGSLFPQPRSPRVADPQNEHEAPIVSYISKVGPIPAGADAEEIESWREAARRFAGHCILIDGRTYIRTGVPIYCAGSTAIRPASTDVFHRYLDVTLPSSYGGALPGNQYKSFRGVMMRPSELKEARRIRRDMAKTRAEGPLLDSPRIICHVDVPVPDLEHLDLVRFAKIHLSEARDSLKDYERQWHKDGMQRALNDPTSKLSRHRAAALAMKEALDAHELRGEGIECVEHALRALAPITHENRFSHFDNVNKQARCNELDVATKIAFERLEAMPIEVPMFTTKVASPAL